MNMNNGRWGLKKTIYPLEYFDLKKRVHFICSHNKFKIVYKKI